MSKPLLPVIDPDKYPWTQFNEEGLQIIEPDEFINRLYKIENINSSSVPDILAHPYVFNSKLKRKDISSLEQFSIIIKGIFLGIIKPEIIKWDELGCLGDIMQHCYPEMEYFVALKWNGKLIGGIYPESLVFPGIEMLDDLIEINKENQRQEKEFGSDTLGYFRRWVESVAEGKGSSIWAQRLWDMTNQGGTWDATHINMELIEPLGNKSIELIEVKVSGNNENVVIPLVSYMGHIIECNQTKTPVRLSDINIKLSLGNGREIVCDGQIMNAVCNNCPKKGHGPTIEEAGFFERSNGVYVIWKGFEQGTLPKGCTRIEYFSNHAILTFGKLKIQINGKVVSKDDICCRNVIKFNDRKIPDLPIKSEYLDCIEMDVDKIESGPVYNIRLKGERILKRNYDNENIIDGERAIILLFPSFYCQRWDVNYVFFRSMSAKLKNKTLVIPFKVEDNEVINLSETKGLTHLNGMKTNQTITHFEIKVNNEQMGIYIVRRKILPPARSGSVKLSLDFGTSNTILAYESGEVEDPYKVLELKDMTIDILKHDKVNKGEIRNNTWWLPTYTPHEEEMLSSIPSELIFRDHSDVFVENLDKSISKYTIPNPYYQREGAFNNVTLNFKWRSSPPFTTEDDSRRVKSAYLKIVMHLALAVIRDMGYNNINFTATYPLAFGYDKYESYKTLLLKDTIPSVAKDTNMSIDFMANADGGRIELISESHSGKARFSSPGYQIVVDIGGGTTDIALSKDNSTLAVDSIRYGGNIFVRLLANNNLIAGAVPTDQCSDNRDIEILLNKEIRSKGFRKGVMDRFDDTDRQRKEIIIQKLKFYYNGILEYIKILIEKHEINTNITLYPVGNAWRFMDAIPDCGGITNYIPEHFEKYNIKISVNPEAYHMGKKAVAVGALQLNKFEHPNLLKPVKTVAGCDEIEIGNDYIGKYEEIPYCLNLDDCNSTEPPTVSTVKFIKKYNRKPKKGKEIVTICEVFNNEIAENALFFEQESHFHQTPKWWLRKSLFGIFLEKIIPEFYL